jgi:hypothetical protein
MVTVMTTPTAAQVTDESIDVRARGLLYELGIKQDMNMLLLQLQSILDSMNPNCGANKKPVEVVRWAVRIFLGENPSVISAVDMYKREALMQFIGNVTPQFSQGITADFICGYGTHLENSFEFPLI